jgi:hypothetical protein
MEIRAHVVAAPAASQISGLFGAFYYKVADQA